MRKKVTPNYTAKTIPNSIVLQNTLKKIYSLADYGRDTVQGSKVCVFAINSGSGGT